MNVFDLISAIGLTISASTVVAVIAVEFAPRLRARTGVAAALGLWFLIVVTLAATGAVHDTSGIGAASVGAMVMLPFLALSAGLFGVRSVRAGLASVPLAPLIAVHAVRVLGVIFLILLAGGRLPAPFAPIAGWGDIAIGLTALPLVWFVAQQRPGWRTAVLIWNTLGLADLATAITLGVLSSPGPLRQLFAEPGSGIMSTLPWLLVPGFLVPLLATIHLAIYYRLKHDSSSPAEALWRAAL